MYLQAKTRVEQGADAHGPQKPKNQTREAEKVKKMGHWGRNRSSENRTRAHLVLRGSSPKCQIRCPTREAEVPQRLSRGLVCNFRTRERTVGVKRAQGKNHDCVGGAGLRDGQAGELCTVG